MERGMGTSDQHVALDRAGPCPIVCFGNGHSVKAPQVFGGKLNSKGSQADKDGTTNN